jgi:Mor family transcriptional regulator
MNLLEAIMAVVGYARVSSVGQSLDVQLDKLKHCDKLFQEKRVQGSLIKTLIKEYKLSKASVYRYLDGVKVAQVVD